MATGDFNGDGYEDLVVAWAIFPHTIEEEQKISAPIHIYLNDGNGSLYEDMSIYKDSEYFIHPFAYRLAIEDFNADGIDDIFAGSMGKHVRGKINLKTILLLIRICYYLVMNMATLKTKAQT